MKIHEYQGKHLLSGYGIAVPRGVMCSSAEEAEDAAKRIIDQTHNPTVVVKAQIHAGGRGKAGGIKVVSAGPHEVAKTARRMLGSKLVTHQTGQEGSIVHRLFVEQGLRIARELYLGVVVDRNSGRIAVMASAEGGVEIEQVAKTTPEKILHESIDAREGLMPFQARRLAFGLQVGRGSPTPKETVQQFTDIVQRLCRLFDNEDCSMCEINPLVIIDEGLVMPLDCKVVFDDNASPRHPEWSALVDPDEENPVELDAKKAGLSYISLGGNIGCLVNGAGLAMATMDIIKHYQGQPANFLDVGGAASTEAVTKAFSMILASKQVEGIFVNIFGGIVRCDVIAEGIINATRQLKLAVPLVVRLAGTNVERGKELLRQSGLRIQAVDTMDEGARMIVAAVQQRAA